MYQKNHRYRQEGMGTETTSPKRAYASILLSQELPHTQHSDIIKTEFSNIDESKLKNSLTKIASPSRKDLTLESYKLCDRLPSFETKLIVFPNILKKTHQNIKSFRNYELGRIDDESIKNYFEAESPKQIKKGKINSLQRAQRSSNHLKSSSDANLIKKHPTLTSVIQPSLWSNHTQASLHLMSRKEETKYDDESFQHRQSQHKFHSIKQNTHGLSMQTSSENLDHISWKLNENELKMNKAYLIQQQHFKDRQDQVWQPDSIQKQLQKRIILTGDNAKVGLREIFLLLYVEDKEVQQFNAQKKIHTNNALHLKVFVFYIPVYKKIQNYEELNDDFDEWQSFLLEVLKMRKQRIKFFYLDGKEMFTLSNIPTFEKTLYVTLEVNSYTSTYFKQQFDLWNVFSKQFQLHGQFNFKKYHILVMRLFDLTTKQDFEKFFKRRENFSQFFEAANQKELDSQYEEQRQKKSVHKISEEQEQIEIDDYCFDQSIFHMGPQQQQLYIQTIQQCLNKQKAKYSKNLDNLEEALRVRIDKIKSQRRKQILPVRYVKKQQQQKHSSIKQGEEEQYERILVHGDIISIEDIKEYAQDKAHPASIIIQKKQPKLHLEPVSDPFELITPSDNKNYSHIIKYINIEKIMCDKNLSRQDVIYYLSVFKSLMDSDKLPQITTTAQQGQIYVPQISENVDAIKQIPKLYISLKQLRRALPYLALYKQTINTKKLNHIFDKRFKCVGFMDFLDIFAYSPDVVGEAEVLDNTAFI